MEGPVVLRGRQRACLVELYRSGADPAVRLRAHIILLLADGWPWDTITRVLYCSTATIARWKRRFEEGGVAALGVDQRGAKPRLSLAWAPVVVGWVKHRLPSDFGLLRSR